MFGYLRGISVRPETYFIQNVQSQAVRMSLAAARDSFGPSDGRNRDK